MGFGLADSLKGIWLPIARRAARAYVAGAALSDAVAACRSLSRKGLSTSLGYWNGDGEPPRQIAREYLQALEAAASEPLRGHLCIKVPALRFDRGLVAEVVGRARARDVLVHFDSLDPESASPTFALIAEAKAGQARLGCTLPARWRRSRTDAARALDLGVNIRVVKGQWAETQGPEPDVRAAFLDLIDRLAGSARHVAVATHDLPLAHEALRRLRGAGTSCELELLFGLPLRRSLGAARAAGVPARVYVPYGHAALPYRMRRGLRDPRLFYRFLHDLIRAGRSPMVVRSL